MARPTVSMEVGNDGVAVITMSNHPANVISVPIFEGLRKKFHEARRRNDVKAIVLTGEGGKFSGGFDLNLVQLIQNTGDLSHMPDISIGFMILTIEGSKKPIVAAMESYVIGGSLEMAMGCHARIAAPRTLLSFPELTLGALPTFGGTQRLPRLVGLKKAIDMMVFSKSMMSEEGEKIGLIDAVVPSGELLNVARRWALDIAETRKPWIQPLLRTDKIENNYEVHNILQQAREQAKQAFKNMYHHQRCIDVIEAGIFHGGYHGVIEERKAYELMISDNAKGLLHMYFSQKATSKVTNVTDIGLKPNPVNKVAVIGGGSRGSGIATALILKDIHVVLKEVNSEYLLKGINSVHENIRNMVLREKLAHDKADRALLRLKGVLNYSEFNDVAMVIEAVVEDVSLKQEIFEELEKICPPQCVLATTTSTIDLNILGEKTRCQSRIIGVHFFSPAHVTPLLEIVRTEKTSCQVILDLITLAKTIKKVPVVVGNCTGFTINRTFFAYSQSAMFLVNLGVDLFRIDHIFTDFGFPMGPFQLLDLCGYDVAIAVSKVFASAFPDRTLHSPLVELMVKYGRRGYYTYSKGSKPKPDPSVLSIIDESRRLANCMPGGKAVVISDYEVIEMILFPVVNEVCRVFGEGVVIRASDLDVASVLGVGFPSYRFVLSVEA